MDTNEFIIVHIIYYFWLRNTVSLSTPSIRRMDRTCLVFTNCPSVDLICDQYTFNQNHLYIYIVRKFHAINKKKKRKGWMLYTHCPNPISWCRSSRVYCDSIDNSRTTLRIGDSVSIARGRMRATGISWFSLENRCEKRSFAARRCVFCIQNEIKNVRIISIRL